jgi:hypothetical protein
MKILRSILLVLAGGIAGCSGGPAVVKVTGIVTYQGNPLAGAKVSFVPTEEHDGRRPPAVAVTDAEGRFALKTNFDSVTRDGAVPGEHVVTISKFVPPNGMTEDAYANLLKTDEVERKSRPYNPEATIPPRIQLLPAAYSDGTRSTLKVKVESSGAQEFPFNLK